MRDAALWSLSSYSYMISIYILLKLYAYNIEEGIICAWLRSSSTSQVAWTLSLSLSEFTRQTIEGYCRVWRAGELETSFQPLMRTRCRGLTTLYPRPSHYNFIGGVSLTFSNVTIPYTSLLSRFAKTLFICPIVFSNIKYICIPSVTHFSLWVLYTHTLHTQVENINTRQSAISFALDYIYTLYCEPQRDIRSFILSLSLLWKKKQAKPFPQMRFHLCARTRSFASSSSHLRCRRAEWFPQALLTRSLSSSIVCTYTFLPLYIYIHDSLQAIACS